MSKSLRSRADSEFLHHAPCPKCGSRDALAVYSSGWGFCYAMGCGHKMKVEDIEAPEEEVEEIPDNFLEGDYQDITSRRLSRQTCKMHGYRIATHHGRSVQVADYRDPKSGKIIAQKLRTKDKKFAIVGEGKDLPLWQQHRHRSGGRAVLVTEGEIDCMVYAELTGNRWPVVSIPNGASGAERVFRAQIEWLESYEKVVICFDSDEPGQAAAEAAAAVLSPGKAFIMRVPGDAKDICDAALKGMRQELSDAFWAAKPWRPDGIVAGQELLDAYFDEQQIESIPYPWKGLNDKLQGIRRRELVTLTAGTGIGKSLVCRVLAAHLVRSGHRVGYIALEESLGRTVSGLLSQFLGVPLHADKTLATEAEVKSCFETYLDGKVCIYSHFGSLDAENLLARIRYMRQAVGVDFIILDHLSILVSGWNEGDGDERRLIDNVMTSLRSIVEQTGVGMVLVSHLRRVSGRKAHEDGGRVSMSDLRGSQAISQLSDTVIGLERDQQDEADKRNTTRVRVLKNRFLGQTGPACALVYDDKTGLLAEAELDFEDGEDDY